MTRTYAAKRLLEHGPLSFADFVAVTGWTAAQCANALEKLQRQQIVIPNGRRGTYRLADELEVA